MLRLRRKVRRLGREQVGGLRFLVATSRPSAAKQPTTGFTLDPQVGPTGGKLGVTYKF